MNNQHDTPEAVEAMAGFFLDRASFGFTYGGTGDPSEWDALMRKRADDAFAMLRRLHTRAMDAERERDEARADAAHTAEQLMQDILRARADALRKAAAFCSLRGYQQIAANLVDLAEKEPRHD